MMLMKRVLQIVFAISAVFVAHGQANEKLRVFFMDVEGGQATLFVTPQGESLLIDTGWPGNNGRDADRIVAEAKKAGLSKIDYVLITHYHDDHVGGVPQLAARIPVGTFIDHGPNRELDHGITEHGYAEYQKILAAGTSKHILRSSPAIFSRSKASTRQSSVRMELSSQNRCPEQARPTRLARHLPTKPADETENARSLGIEIDFGKLRLDRSRRPDLGQREGTHVSRSTSSAPSTSTSSRTMAGIRARARRSSMASHPRVAIMDNGEKKGGSPGTLDTLHSSPGLEALYQLHYSTESADKNTAAEYIANLQGTGRRQSHRTHRFTRRKLQCHQHPYKSLTQKTFRHDSVALKDLRPAVRSYAGTGSILPSRTT
jgi:competence protein ComEC